MNSKLFNVFKAFLLLFILLAGLFAMNSVLYLKTYTNYAWNEFYNLEEDILDVVFLGSSHNYNAFVPMISNSILEADSYNISSDGQTIEQTYFILKEVLKTQSPKVVTIEMFSIRPYDLEDIDTAMIHKAFDKMKFSLNKIDAINYNVIYEDKLEYFFPLATYHLKWKDDDIKTQIENEYDENWGLAPYFGYDNKYTVEYPIVGEYSQSPEELTDEKKYLDDDRMEILDKITKLCKDNDIKLMYVTTPFISQVDFTYVDQYKYLNGLKEYTDANNIDVINFNLLYEELEMDKTYLADDGHVNISGAQLITEYTANFIKDNYGEIFEDVKWDMMELSEAKKEWYLKEYDKFMEDKAQIKKKSY